MLIFFYRKGFEASLVKVPRPFGVIMCVPPHRMGMGKPPKEIGDLSFGFWLNDEMPMIRHHGVSENGQSDSLVCQFQDSLKCLIVFSLFK